MFKALTRLTMLVCIAAMAFVACGDDRTAEPAADSIAPAVVDDGTADSVADTIAPAIVVEPDQVIELYNDQAGFVSAARENPDAKLSALYAEHVIDPYWEQCFFALVPTYEPAHFAARLTLRDIDRLSASVDALRAGKAADMVATALAATRGNVDTPPVTLCVLAGYPATTGQLLDDVGGVMTASSEDALVVMINPEIDGWQELLGYTIARDCHLSAQGHGYWDPDQVPTLLEAVVSTGKAHSFAELLFPAAYSRQTDVLTPGDEARLWKQMSPDLNSDDPELLEAYLLIPNRGVGIPRWTGVTIGYHIVQEYLETHPEATIDDWTMLDAATLLAESGYTGGT